jgi:hypothetical protein
MVGGIQRLQPALYRGLDLSIIVKNCALGLDCNFTDATELPMGSAADNSQNVLYSKGTIATPYGFETVGAALDSGNPVLHISSWTELDKTQHLLAVTKDKVYDRDFVTVLWDEKTQDYDTTAISLGGNINNPVSSATILHTDGILFNGIGSDYAYVHHILCMGYTMPTATADNSPIQRWAGKDETHYTDLLGADGYHHVSSSKTKHFAYQVGSFYNRLLLINPLEYDASSVFHENNQRIRWSMAGKLEVAPAWSGTGSGFYDLLDTGGHNVWGALLGMQWIQYQNNSIWSLTHVGGTTVFVPNIEMPDLGLLGAHCVYSKNNIHYFVGNDYNVYAYTGGSNLTRIGDKIQKYIQRDLDPIYANQCYMCMGSNNSRLWLFIVPKNSLYITQAYGMDMRTGVWMKRDYTHKWPTGGITSVALVGAGGYHAGEATALYQYCNTDDDGAHPVISGASWLAQTFTTTTSHNATSVRLKLYKTTGTSPGTVTVSLRATSSNLPTGADLCVGTVNGDDFTESTDGAWVKITFLSNPVLAASTKYAIIVRSTAASIGWRWETTTPAYTTGDSCYSLDSGATWPNVSGNITAFALASGSISAFANKTIYEYYTASNNNYLYTASSGQETELAQTFTPSVSHTVTCVNLKLFRYGSPGNVTISIRTTDGNGHPTSSVLCSATIDANVLTTNTAGEEKLISLGTGTPLTAGTKYAIVVKGLNGDGANCTGVRMKASNVYAGGCMEYSTNNGSSWSTTFDWDFWFEEGVVETTKTIITSANHGLSNGQSVIITSTTNYNGTYAISEVATNTFKIVETYVANDATGTWTSVDGNIKVTSASHTLSNGDTVIIADSTDYNGTYVIAGVTATIFNITATWTQTRTGTWSVPDFMFDEYGSAIGSDVILLTDEKLTLGDSAGQVYQYKSDLTTDDTVSIPARHITEIYDLGLPSKNKLWPSLVVTAKGTGLIVSYRTGNFETIGTGWTAFTEQVLTSEFVDYTFFINDTSRKVQFRFSNVSGGEFEISNYSLVDPAIQGGV